MSLPALALPPDEEPLVPTPPERSLPLPARLPAAGGPQALTERRICLEAHRLRQQLEGCTDPEEAAALQARLEAVLWRLVLHRDDLLWLWARLAASRYQGILPADELHQEALLTALQTARTYRLDGGASWSTYAGRAVRSRLRFLCRQAVRLQARTDALEAPLWEDAEAPCLLSRLAAEAPEEKLEPWPWAVYLDRARLTPRHRHILTRRLGLDGQEPATLQQLADTWGVSRTRIHQLSEQALDALRQVLPTRRPLPRLP